MRRARPLIIAVMIASLALAAWTRRWADDQRRAAAVDPNLPMAAGDAGESGAGGKLSNMNSFALGLLLGGLRGPLVMFLWTSSENQKSAHNLEDFDTKVEWIRLLQPEFDTVHLYQIWNKAYNISVQMTSLANKYSTILDALDYANDVDRQRPDDINILFDIARVYGDKLGISHEAPYYIPRVRLESQAVKPVTRVTLPIARLADFLDAAHATGMDQVAAPLETDEPSQTVTVTLEKSVADALRAAWTGKSVTFVDVSPRRAPAEGELRRDRLETMLDENGNVLPSMLATTHPRPANLAPDALWYDGSKLEFLKQYEPFPYGLSPQAISYNYYKRSQMLMLVAHESHVQTSDFVVDSRPGLELKFWGAQEGEDGRRAELRLFGLDDTGDRVTLEYRAPGASIQQPNPLEELSHRPDPAAGPRALDAYGRAARLYRDSYTELAADLRRYPRSRFTFLSHLDDDVAFTELYQADHDFLAGAIDSGARATDWAAAADHYEKARQGFTHLILKYYVEDALANQLYPKDRATGLVLSHEGVDQIPPDEQDQLLTKVVADLTDFLKSHASEHGDDRNENLGYLDRCNARIKMIGSVKGG